MTLGVYEKNELRLQALATVEPDLRQKFRLGRLLEVQQGSGEDGEPVRFTLNFGTDLGPDMPILFAREPAVKTKDKELEPLLNGDGLSLLAHPALQQIPVTGVEASRAFGNARTPDRGFFKHAALARVEWLSTHHLKLKPVAAVIEKSPHLGGLRWWDVGYTSLPLSALSASKSLKNLRHLGVSNNGLAAKDFLALLTGENFRHLTSLDFSGNTFGRVLADLGSRSELGRFEQLDLTCHETVDWTPFVASPHLSRLRSLTISFKGKAPALTADKLPALRTLVLSSNEPPSLSLPQLEDLTLKVIEPSALEALAADPASANLRSLNLELYGTAAQGLPALFASPHLAKLERFSLAVQEGALTPAARLDIVQRLAFPALRELRLSFPESEPSTMEALVRALSSSRLEVLSFSGSWGAEGMACLAGAPWLAGLKRLRALGTRCGARGLTALGQSPHVRNLETLILGEELDDQGLAALLESPNFQRLVELDVSVPENASPALVERLEARVNLPKLWVGPSRLAKVPEVRSNMKLWQSPF